MLRLRLLEQALHIMQNQDDPRFLCFFDCKYIYFWAQLQISVAYFCSIGLYFLV